MSVENEWHGFDKKWHARIHPTFNKTCSMCHVEQLAAKVAELEKDNEKLKLALHSANGGTLYSCTICGKSCMTDFDLAEHKKTHAKPDNHERRIQCMKCGGLDVNCPTCKGTGEQVVKKR